MTTKFTEGDLIIVNTRYHKGEKFKYGFDNYLTLGDADSPITSEVMRVTKIDPDGSLEVDHDYWYDQKWVQLHQNNVRPQLSLEEKIDKMAEKIDIMMEILGVVEDDN